MKYIHLLSFFILVGLAACSDAPDGPSAKDIEKAIALSLPVGLEVDSVEVQVSDNIGTKVEPEYNSRAKVVLAYTQDFYSHESTIAEKAVVLKKASKGDELQGIVLTYGTLKADDTWAVRITRLDVPLAGGEAASQFGTTALVLENSSEHKALLEEAEAERLRAEAEAERLKAEAAAKRAEQVAALRSALTGEWASSSPMALDGFTWADRNGRRLGIALTFLDGVEERGVGAAVMYDIDAPIYQQATQFSYKLENANTGVWSITFARDTGLDRPNFTIYKTTNMKLDKDGILYVPGNRGSSFTLPLEKDGSAGKARAGFVQAYNGLLEKHQPANGTGQMDSLPQGNNTYALYMVEGSSNGRVIGTGVYGHRSDLRATTVHAGLLAPGEFGVVKVSKFVKRNNDPCIALQGSERNGIKSLTDGGYCYGQYRVELVEKLTVN